MRATQALTLMIGAALSVQSEIERRAFRAAATMADPIGIANRLSKRSHPVVLDDSDDSVWLQVADYGTGRPVVCLHGWGHAMDAWSYVAALMPADVRFIAVDLRGHGESSAVPMGGDATLLADDVARLLERLDLHDVLLVGHSLGGIVTLTLAATNPEALAERVSGLVLVSTKARGAQADLRSKMLAAVLQSRTFARAGAAPVLGLMLARRAFAGPIPMGRLRLTRDIARQGDVEHRMLFDLFKLGDISAGLAKVSIPAMILCGSADPATPLHDAHHLAEVLPHATLRVVEGAGHLLPLERPDAVADAITAMLDTPIREGVLD